MTPIKTIIKNKTSVEKTIHYAGKKPVWLPANGEAVVDFEIWSVADNVQKTAITTLINNGAIELSIMVLSSNGEYTVAQFDPCGGVRKSGAVEVKREEPALLNPLKNMTLEKDHIVKVGGTETKAILDSMGAKAVGFDDEEILPPREIKNGEPEPKEAAVEQEEPAEPEEVKTEAKKRTRKSAKSEE